MTGTNMLSHYSSPQTHKAECRLRLIHEKMGSENLSNLPRLTELAHVWAGVQILVFLTLKPIVTK